MPSIAAAAAQLRADERPVLFLDTCIIVDVIRATLRCLGTNFVQSAIDLRGRLRSTPPGCALVVASLVPTEWGNHAPRTRDEVRGHLAKIQDQAQHFHAACGALDVGLGYGLPAYPTANLHDRLFDLSKEILDLAAVLDPDGECATRAIGRVAAKLAPSRQGGEMKDCVIVEECLELTRQLRANGFAKKCVFCTSNTNDYGNPDPNLAVDFLAANLTLPPIFLGPSTRSKPDCLSPPPRSVRANPCTRRSDTPRAM